MLCTTRRMRRYSTLYILRLHIECRSLDVELYLHLLQPLPSAGIAIHGALVISRMSADFPFLRHAHCMLPALYAVGG